MTKLVKVSVYVVVMCALQSSCVACISRHQIQHIFVCALSMWAASVNANCTYTLVQYIFIFPNQHLLNTQQTQFLFSMCARRAIDPAGCGAGGTYKITRSHSVWRCILIYIFSPVVVWLPVRQIGCRETPHIYNTYAPSHQPNHTWWWLMMTSRSLSLHVAVAARRRLALALCCAPIHQSALGIGRCRLRQNQQRCGEKTHSSSIITL